MTDYDPHLRRLMRTLVQRAASQDASTAAWLRQEFSPPSATPPTTATC